jgi:hypothetical protein
VRTRLYKVIEHFYPPYSGAKWIRVQNTVDTINCCSNVDLPSA